MSKPKMRHSLAEIAGYLKMKKVPPSMIQQIRYALACDAVEEASNLHWDRVYTALSLALHERYGYDAKEIVECLSDVNGVFMRLEDDAAEWQVLMQELRDKTGLIVRTGEGQRTLVEYVEEEGEDDDTE